MFWVLKGVRFFEGLLLALTPRDPGGADWKLAVGELPKLWLIETRPAASLISCGTVDITSAEGFSRYSYFEASLLFTPQWQTERLAVLPVTQREAN